MGTVKKYDIVFLSVKIFLKTNILLIIIEYM